MKDLKTFISDVASDKVLAAKLEGAGKAQIAAVVEIAKAEGYDFTVGDMEAYLKEEKKAAVSNDNRCYTVFENCYVILT